ERRDDALEQAELMERSQGVGVGGGHVLDTAAVAERAVLGTDARIVEAGADRMGGKHLAAGILHQVAQRPVEHAGASSREWRRVFAAVQPPPGRLDTDQAN